MDWTSERISKLVTDILNREGNEGLSQQDWDNAIDIALWAHRHFKAIENSSDAKRGRDRRLYMRRYMRQYRERVKARQTP